MIMWKKIDNYYLENAGWTICQYKDDKNKFSMWQHNVFKGWFANEREAKAKYEELIKG